MPRLTARQKRAEEKRRRLVRDLNEYWSGNNALVKVTCPNGHHLKSHSVFDDKGRTKAVVWSCSTCGAQTVVKGKGR
jgi:hypothetical protein